MTDPNFPDGKITEDDEGVLGIQLFMHDDRLILNFGKQVSWVGMDRKTAMTVGQALIDRAKDLPVN